MRDTFTLLISHAFKPVYATLTNPHIFYLSHSQMGNTACCKKVETDAQAAEKKIAPGVETVAKDVLAALGPVLQAMEARIIQQIVQQAATVVQKV